MFRLLLVAVLACMRVHAAADCGSTDPASPCLAQEVSTERDGITFTWQFNCDGGDCQTGRFMDGSPWVRHPSGGNVTITSVTPDDEGDGFEKNTVTGTEAESREQGLLTCAGTEAPYVSSKDLSTQLPYQAAPDDAVYLKVRRYTDGDCGYTASVGACCVAGYAALTVLKDLPPDGKLGAETFRPGMAGDEKEFFTIDDFDLTRLPSIPNIILSTSYESIIDHYLDGPMLNQHSGINGDLGRRWTPRNNGLADYAASRAEQNNTAIFKVLDGGTLTGDKLQAVYGLIQFGLDIFAAYDEGVHWTGGAGQQQGRYAPMVFMGALCTDESVRNRIRAATENVATDADRPDLGFTELYQLRPSINGDPIWGSKPNAPNDGCNQGGYDGTGRYWADYTRYTIRNESYYGKGICGDPYGYIDGPAETPGTVYSLTATGIYVNIGLLQRIWAEFDYVANNPVMKGFATRIMDGAGWWTLPDECAAFDPREPSDCGPYSTSNTCQYFGTTWGHDLVDNDGTCVTIAEATARGWNGGSGTPTSRWPDNHLAGRPTLERETPGYQRWDMLIALYGSTIIEDAGTALTGKEPVRLITDMAAGRVVILADAFRGSRVIVSDVLGRVVHEQDMDGVVIWNGMDRAGVPVANGVYTVTLAGGPGWGWSGSVTVIR